MGKKLVFCSDSTETGNKIVAIYTEENLAVSRRIHITKNFIEDIIFKLWLSLTQSYSIFLVSIKSWIGLEEPNKTTKELPLITDFII